MSVNSISSALSSLLGGSSSSSTSSSSSSSSSSTFSFAGIVSGLDTTSIIQKLVAIQQAPIQQYQSQISTIQSRDKAYQDVKSKLTAVQTALSTLMQQSSINTKAASVTAPTGSTPSLTATATSTAVNGAYTVNVTQVATASSVTTSNPISRGVATDAVLSGSGMTTSVTAGTFSINGASISVDPATDTLASVVGKINASSANVTASIVNDANGNPNYISISPNDASQSVQLGSGADTSNFLSATGLVATNVVGGTVQSATPLSEMMPGNELGTQPFNLPSGTTLAGSGSFTVNGTTINWSGTDSLSTVLNRINSSQAGVLATYNAQTDKVSLTNLATGNQAVSVSETAAPAGQSGLLAALGLTGSSAAATAGNTAQYTLATNGGTPGPTQYSNSNTITNIPGMTLNLTGTGSSTVNISQDTSTATNNVNAFITAFNAAVDTIDTDTKYDSSTKTSGVLAGDSTITGIESQLKSMLTTPALVPAGSAYATLGDIGISTGAYGATAGSTNHLVLDSTKLTTALQNNANAVFSVLSGLTGTATLTDANGNPLSTGSSWLQSVTGTPLNVASSGRYTITYNPANSVNNLASVFSGMNIGSSATATGTIMPGASSALIPGMVLNVKPDAQAGTEYVNYQVSSSGVLQNVNNYLNSVLGAGGVFDVEAQGAAQQTTDINNQISSMNSRITQYQQTLQAQFSAMEASLATLQQQAGSLGIQLTNSNSSGSSSSK